MTSTAEEGVGELPEGGSCKSFLSYKYTTLYFGLNYSLNYFSLYGPRQIGRENNPPEKKGREKWKQLVLSDYVGGQNKVSRMKNLRFYSHRNS